LPQFGQLVIASEAKQSIYRLAAVWIASSQVLLAMTLLSPFRLSNKFSDSLLPGLEEKPAIRLRLALVIRRVSKILWDETIHGRREGR
jgi:hypothetical protein